MAEKTESAAEPVWQLPVSREQALSLLAESSEELETAEETSEDRVALMLGEVKQDSRAYVHLSRVNPNGSHAYCGKYTPQQFEAGYLDLIREDWGPGKYHIKLYGIKPGTDRFVIRTREDIEILAKRNEPENSRGLPSEFSQAMAQMQETQRQMLQALTERPPAPDPMAQMTTMMQMAATMREAFGIGNQSANNIKDIIDAVRAMKDVSEEINPPKVPENETSALLSLAGPLLQTIQMGMQQKQISVSSEAVSAVANSASEIATPTIAPVSQTQQQDQKMDIATIALIGNFQRIMNLAASNADPQLGADIIVEKLPDEMIDLLETAEWFTLLCQVAPGASAHQEWLTKARDLALAELNQPDDTQSGAGGVAPAA